MSRWVDQAILLIYRYTNILIYPFTHLRTRCRPPYLSIMIATVVVICLSYVYHLQAAPTIQVPVVGPDAVTTPVLRATPTPTLRKTDRPKGYHASREQQSYVVQAGDTLWDVAFNTGLDIEAVPCAVAPDFQTKQPLVIGDLLQIPAADTLCHQVDDAESLATIAALYQMTPADIAMVPWNQLQEIDNQAILPKGRYLQIPLMSGVDRGSVQPLVAKEAENFLTWMLEQPIETSPFIALAVGCPFAQQIQPRNQQGRAVADANQPGVVPEYWPYGSGNFTWPLAGWLTQGYRYDHRAIDVAAPTGTIVTAADRGVVMRAGWNNQGYGLFVIIDHNIDYVTLYAHLGEILVEEGQVVAQGEIIGKVGSTGNSTGPHLHFEIRDFGRLTNPLELLVQ